MIDRGRLATLFEGLVGIYSPSGKEERVLAFLEEYFVAEGCPYGVQPVDADRYNLLLGRLDAPLLFVGHVDTVAIWDLDAIGPEGLPGGWVRGLGAADMKGGCAALIEAFLVLRREGLANEFGLALVVGEEEEGDGTRALLAEGLPGRAVVGEPTGLDLCVGHYGYLEVLVRARGKRAHASIPERGENAAEAVLKALCRLLEAPGLAPEAGPVLNVRHLETVNPGFAVPERATAWLDLHLPPGFSLEAAKDETVRVVDDPRVELEFRVAHEGFRLPDADPLVRAFLALGRGGIDVFRSHSDANLFHAAGVPTAVLGPGRLEYAHSEEERVDFAEVVAAAELYVDLARCFRTLGEEPL